MSQILRDTRYSVRSLWKSPGFAVAAVLTLALGIGANTAVFNVLYGVALAPLPYRDPERLVAVMVYNRTLRYPTYLSYQDFLDWQRDSRSFEQIAAYSQQEFNLTNPGTAEHLTGDAISSRFFQTLGVRLALGRDSAMAEDHTGGMRVVILSHRLWQQRFGGRPSALGKILTLDNVGYTVAGVLQEGFRFEERQPDVYIPLGSRAALFNEDRTNHDVLCIARLRPGVTVGQAWAEMNAVQERIDRLHPATERGLGVYIDPLKHFLIGDTGATLVLLLGAVGFVLLIACANVANLLLARTAGRRREFAVRQALGASRMQIIGQLLTESLVVSLSGGALGLLLAAWGPKLILAAVPGSLPRTGNIGVHAAVLLFALTISIVVGVAFGLLPALRSSSTDLQEGLKDGGRGSTRHRFRAQDALVVAQIALAVVLLTGGSLLLRTMRNLWAANPGFDAQHLLTFQVGLSPSATQTGADTRAAYQQLLGRIREVPGVRAADFTALVPLSQRDNSGPFWVGMHQPRVSMAEIPRARYFWTGPEYQSTMKIPLLRGRYLSRADTVNSAKVVVIDDVLARTYFPGHDPVGQTVTVAHWGAARIVGVVGHVRHWGVGGPAAAQEQPEIYASFYQLLDEWVPIFRKNLNVVVRTSLGVSAMMAAIKRAVYGSGSDQPIYNVHTMEELVAGSMAQRLPMLLLSVFAGLALLLASVGIYGVVSYSMSQRVHEIGIRVALGARRRDVLRMVLGQGLRLALTGVGVGVLGALILVRSLSSFSRLLYGVQANDPWTLAGVSAVLLSAALLACYVPARRAARVDAMVALRHE